MKGFGYSKAVGNHNNLVEYARKGALRGVYLGFPNIHENYTMSLPGVTDWTGFPRSGKTQVLMEFLLNTSVFYGWKHLVYFPDVGNDIEIIADLIHKYTGKTFDKRFNNHISEEEIAAVTPWVDEHFKILTKKDLKAKLTPYEFWDEAVKMKDQFGIKTASIDSWKDLYHNTRDFGRDDKYLEDVLSYRNAISDNHGLHFHTIVHPLKTEKDSEGNRRPPTPYDIKGGTEWFNNQRNQITVHRPNGTKNKVEVYFNKIKPRSIGEVGVQEMYFDTKSFRYYILDGGDQRFAEEEYYKMKNESYEEDNEQEDELPF